MNKQINKAVLRMFAIGCIHGFLGGVLMAIGLPILGVIVDATWILTWAVCEHHLYNKKMLKSECIDVQTWCEKIGARE